MENRLFRIVSVSAMVLMLSAMIVITCFSVSAFDPLDGEESAGEKTTMGPLDSHEDEVSHGISYPDDYYSSVTYGPLDDDESEEDESSAPTATGSATDTATETSGTETSGTETSATETSATETSATETSATETAATESSGTETTATEAKPSASTPLYGDANDDGAVNMKDVLLVRKYLAEIPVTVCFENADVDGSGAVNMKDVLSIRKYLAELIDTLGPNK